MSVQGNSTTAGMNSLPGYLASTASSRAHSNASNTATTAAPKKARAKRATKAATTTDNASTKPPLILDAPGIVRVPVTPFTKSTNAVKQFPEYTTNHEPEVASAYQPAFSVASSSRHLPATNSNSFARDANKNLVGHPYQDVSMADLHPVFFQLEEGQDMHENDDVAWEQDEHGNAVTNTEGRRLRKIADLPRYLTRAMNGVHLELLFRLNSRLVPNDIIDRMDEDVFNTRKAKAMTNNAINMARKRFRSCLKIKSWKGGKTWPAMTDIEVLGHLTAQQVCYNTTMVIEDGKLWQPVFDHNSVIVHYVDSGLPLDYFLQARTTDVPSHKMLNAAALRCRVQTVAMLNGKGNAADNWTTYGDEKGVPQEQKNLPYWFNFSNSANRGTGDVASSRGAEKFADGLKEKERKVDEIDGLTHSAFMEEYAKKNPKDTIKVAPRAKANQVKGDAARSAKYQVYRTVTASKPENNTRAALKTYAGTDELEPEQQSNTPDPLAQYFQEVIGEPFSGNDFNQPAYAPRLPLVAPGQMQGFARPARGVKRHANDDANEIFSTLRPDSDRSIGQVASKIDDAKRRKTAQPLGETGVKRRADSIFDDDDENSASNFQLSVTKSGRATSTGHRKTKVRKTGLVRPPKGAALTRESGFPEQFGYRDAQFDQETFAGGFDDTLSHERPAQEQPASRVPEQPTHINRPPSNSDGIMEPPQPSKLSYGLMRADSGYGSQTPSLPSHYNTPASADNEFADEERHEPADEAFPPSHNLDIVSHIDSEGSSAGKVSGTGGADHLVSHTVGGQQAKAGPGKDALLTQLENLGDDGLDLGELEVGRYDFGTASATQPALAPKASVTRALAESQVFFTQPAVVTPAQASTPQPVPAAQMTGVSEDSKPFLNMNLLHKITAADSSINAYNQVFQDNPYAMEFAALRPLSPSRRPFRGCWQISYGHILGPNVTREMVDEYLKAGGEQLPRLP